MLLVESHGEVFPQYVPISPCVVFSSTIQDKLQFAAHVQPTANPLRLSPQLRVEADDSPQSVDFYVRHGFVRFTTDEALPEGRTLLAGDRDAALTALRTMATSTSVTPPGDRGGEAKGGADAVAMNLMARLLHDAGDLAGAVDAYLKALEVQ